MQVMAWNLYYFEMLKQQKLQSHVTKKLKTLRDNIWADLPFRASLP